MTSEDQQIIRALVREEIISTFHDYARGQTAAIHRIQVSDADLASASMGVLQQPVRLCRRCR